METQIYIDWINHCGGAWVQTILLWKEWIVCFSLSLSSDGFRLQRQIKLDDQLCKVWLTWQCHCCLSCLQNSATWQFYCCLFCFVQFCPPADVQVVQIELCKVLLQSADHALQSADGAAAPILLDSVWQTRPLCCSNWVREPFVIIIPLRPLQYIFGQFMTTENMMRPAF